jgi:hypothetical protein
MLDTGKRTVLKDERIFTEITIYFSLTNGYLKVCETKYGELTAISAVASSSIFTHHFAGYTNREAEVETNCRLKLTPSKHLQNYLSIRM